MSAFTVWSDAAVARVDPRATTSVNALSRATVQLTSVSGPTPDPGIASGVGVTRVHSRTPSGSGSPEATPCRKAGASVVTALAGRAPASGAASTAVAAAAFTTVRLRGDGELASAVAGTPFWDDLYRLVTADQVTDRYTPEWANSPKFAHSSRSGPREDPHRLPAGPAGRRRPASALEGLVHGRAEVLGAHRGVLAVGARELLAVHHQARRALHVVLVGVEGVGHRQRPGVERAVLHRVLELLVVLQGVGRVGDLDEVVVVLELVLGLLGVELRGVQGLLELQEGLRAHVQRRAQGAHRVLGALPVGTDLHAVALAAVAVQEGAADELDLVLARLVVLQEGRAHRLLEGGADRAARVLVQLQGLLRAVLADDDGRAVLARGVRRGDDLRLRRRLPRARLVGLDDGVPDAAGYRQDADHRAGDDDLPPDLRPLRLALALRAQALPGRRLRRLAVPLAHADVLHGGSHTKPVCGWVGGTAGARRAAVLRRG